MVYGDGGGDGGGHGHESVPASSLIGVAICIAGNVCISCALNVQKLAHKRLARRSSFTGNNNNNNSAQTSSSSSPAQPRTASGERSPLLPTNTPSGIPSQPAPLKRSVSDPALRNVAPGQYLVPVTMNGIGQGKPVRRTASRSRSSQSVRSKSGKKKGDGRPRLDKGYLREPLWWLGIGLMTAGEFGNFLSYSFAPASLVAPLGSVALVANVGLAPLIVKEPFRRRDLFGCLLIILGCALVVHSSKQQDAKLYPEQILHAIAQPLFIVYSCISIAAIGALLKLSRTKYGDRYVLVDLGICALSGAFTVLATKAISSFLTLLFLDTFRYPITYPILLVLGLTAFVQVNFVNKALQRFPARQVVPVQFISFALSTIVGSAVLYREFDDVSLDKFLNFAFGCLVSGAGVHLITRESPDSSSDANKDDTRASQNDPHQHQQRQQQSQHDADGLPVVISDASQSPSPARTGGAPFLTASNASAAHSPTSARKLSLTLGGTQYLLAHSPGKSLYGRGDRTRLEEEGDESASDGDDDVAAAAEEEEEDDDAEEEVGRGDGRDEDEEQNVGSNMSGGRKR